LDDCVYLDELAAKIIKEIVLDGLFWIKEFKKVPVAFGIFKLIIGFLCEDEKISVDDVVEMIEAYDEFVQSVEISNI
jgi:elongation factor 1-beta